MRDLLWVQWEETEEESMAPLQTAEAAAKRGGVEFVVECGAGGWRERDCRIGECQAFFRIKSG